MSKQVLCAAVDDAATEAEWDALIAALDDEPELKSDWSRIWQTRDAREGISLVTGEDFCQGVMAAIAKEAPLPSRVVSLPRRAAKVLPARGSRNWRTLVPLSAAAGIVAAVLFVGGLRSTESNPAAVLSASSNAPLATMPVSWAQHSRSNEQDDAKAAILNAYLMEHSNSLAERSMSGTLANARFAARTADYRPDTP
jgi:negative regulator of sigma E activity